PTRQPPPTLLPYTTLFRSQEEIAAYEKERDALVANSVAAGFIEAQQNLHEVQETVNQYISKTLELGRVPSEEEMEGCCGGGGGQDRKSTRLNSSHQIISYA